MVRKDMSLTAARIAAYDRQRGRCCYCGNPMWERSMESREAAGARFVRWTPYRALVLNQIDLDDCACTAEHSVAKADGGTDDPSNITGACRYCNSRRGRTPHKEWQQSMLATLPEVKIGVEQVPQLDGTVVGRPWSIRWGHLIHIEASTIQFFDWHNGTPDELITFCHSDVLLFEPHRHVVSGFRILMCKRSTMKRASRYWGKAVIA